LATNPHEGHRSEYLAQYVFASFGAAVAVPQAEDCGLDLYCTLTERDGRRSWARAMFSVQVKSNPKAWVFDSPEAVQWLVRLPVPVLLCAVDKSQLRLRVYHTFPRFQMWTLEKERSDCLELVPGKPESPEAQCGVGSRQALGEPILDFTIAQLTNDGFHAQVRDVLRNWLRCDETNINWLQAGLRRFSRPDQYRPNEWNPSGWVTQSLTGYGSDSFDELKRNSEPLLEELARQFLARGDEAGAAVTALVLRRMNRQWHPGFITSFLTSTLNTRLGHSGYLFAGLDRLELIEEAVVPGKEVPR
jgi:hypothetical protein